MKHVLYAALVATLLASTPLYASNGSHRQIAATPKVDITPYLGSWALFNEQGQALPDLDVHKGQFLYGGDPVVLNSKDIVEGALYISFNGLNVTLKKNGEGRWVSVESSGYLKRK